MNKAIDILLEVIVAGPVVFALLWPVTAFVTRKVQ